MSPSDDLLREIRKLVVVVSALLERFARAYEELDGNRLALEELRELLKEHFEESSRWADGLSKRIDRLEQWVILTRAGDKRQAGTITQQVTGEHLRQGLKEQLLEQQALLQQYHKNVGRIKLRIAKFGESTELANELEDNEREIQKTNEAIERIREALN